MIRAAALAARLPLLPTPPPAKQGDLVLHAHFHQVQVAVPDVGGDGVAHVIHGDVIGRTGAAVLTVDGQTAGIGVAREVVEHRHGR
jgi:hypothetical protein